MTRRSAFPPITMKPFSGESESGYGPFNVSTIGYDGTSYRIKVLQAQFQTAVETMDITGELAGDLTGSVVRNIRRESMRQIRGRVTFSGHVPDSAAIGIANIEGESLNEIDCEFLLGVGDSDPSLSISPARNIWHFKMVVEDLTVDWNLDLPYIGLTISGPLTGSPNSRTSLQNEPPIIEASS